MILDTNAISALLAGDPAVGELLDGEPRHHIPVVSLGEYRYGLRRSSRRSDLEPLLDLLAADSRILAVDEGTARAYAAVRDELRLAGRPMPENDVWIAALARQHDLAVVSRDRHFDAVEGLVRHGW